jgi:hypothetical protein
MLNAAFLNAKLFPTHFLNCFEILRQKIFSPKYFFVPSCTCWCVWLWFFALNYYHLLCFAHATADAPSCSISAFLCHKTNFPLNSSQFSSFIHHFRYVVSFIVWLILFLCVRDVFEEEKLNLNNQKINVL